MERTIAAIATPKGSGGISIIRISGADAVRIAASVFSRPDTILNADSHTIHYGFVVDDGKKVDEVLVSVMRAPKTYTGEDVVEINSHGGIVVTNKVLDCVIRAGAYHAEPGEFTKRAFINGKMDLTRAEAVIDLINAKNELSRKNAFSQLEGSLGDKISEVRSKLINLAANMQVAIDYPDEDLEDIDRDGITEVLKCCRDDISKLIKSAENGKIVSEGIVTAIVGKPNVGKSSLLNTLSGYERAIVTDIAGTTRDIITENVNLDGIPLSLFDTAGIHETEDVVEKIGVSRSQQAIENADLVIMLLDASGEIEEADIEILKSVKDKKHIIAVNKTDMQSEKNDEKYEALAEGSPIVFISAKKGDGLDKLSEAVRNMFDLGELETENNTVITNMRHKTALYNAYESINAAIVAMESGVPQDLITIDMNNAMDSLGEITGASVSEDVVNEIFHRFCVGK